MLAVRRKQATISAATTRHFNGVTFHWFAFERYFLDHIRQAGFSIVLQSDFFNIAGDLDWSYIDIDIANAYVWHQLNASCTQFPKAQ